MVLPFHPQASVRCRCASYIYHSHVRRAKASRRWLCAATALVRCREDDSKNPIYAGTKEDSWTFFFFVKADVLFLKALLLCLFGGERQGFVVRPFLASSPLSIVKIDVSEISKPPTRLPHPEKWQLRSLKMLSYKKEVLWAATHSGVQTAAAGNNTLYPNF